MNYWEPNNQLLTELLKLLREAVNPTCGQNVQKKLEFFNTVPDYNCYLVYILTKTTQEDQYIRSVAGLTLKNNIRAHYSNIPPYTMEHVKQTCLEHIGDADIGKTIALVISAIMSQGLVQNWVVGLEALMAKLDDPSPIVVALALTTLQRICEDCSHELIRPMDNIRPLDFMIPKFLSYFTDPNVELRLSAIRCVQQFITLQCEPLLQRMDVFLGGLFKLATDDNMEIRKTVCQSLVNVFEFRPESLLPQMPNLVDYMLYSTLSDDEDLALEACEFWLVFAGCDELLDHLRIYLPKVIPVLLKCMVYSDADLAAMTGEEDDARVADNEQDIKPRFHRANVVDVEREIKGRDDVDVNKTTEQGNEDDDLEDDDDDDYYSEDDDDIFNEWNLRKCSAAALDSICTSHEEAAIHLLMPLLKTELESDNWLHRECGILALGAAAEGGMQDIAPHLPELVPFLFAQLNDAKPLVRSITCWTLGRYTHWIAQASQQSPEAYRHYLDPFVQIMLQRILDNNKRVQEAACSSLSLLEEEATTQLIPYLHPILVTLAAAFEKYQHHNLLLLLDTLGTLADVVGEALNVPQYIELVIPPLIKQWQVTPDDSSDLFPLLECLSSVTSALGKGFKPFAEPVYIRCVNLVCDTLKQCQAADGVAPEKDFMIVALDLISGIVQALNTDAKPLIANTNPSIVSFLAICINDEVAEVRQSSYALLGDLAISCFEHIRSVIPQFMPHLLQQIGPNPKYESVCNNATWAAGEIAIRLGNEIQPYVEPLLQRLFPLMVSSINQRTLLENVAITIGRLALICPALIAQYLENFVEPWLQSLSPVRDNEEKASAFSGLCEMIKINPQGALQSFPSLCVAIVNYQVVPPSLKELFGKILVGYRTMYGEQVFANIPQEIRSAIRDQYDV